MTNLSVGQGHGIEGRYGGLPDPFAQELSSEIVLIPVPFDKTTTYKKGTDKGPSAIIEASRNMELYDIETDFEVYLKGIYTAPPILAKTSEKMVQAAYLATKNYLEKGKFVVAIGGEHAVSYGPIRAHAERYPNLTILQFDAHADLYAAYENNPWSHASVIARVKEIPTVEKVVSIGIRSLGKEEAAVLDRSNTFFAHELDEKASWMEDVLGKLSDPVYITFDLDVFDSALMPSTGTPEPGGLSWNQVLKILKKVAQQNNIVGFDVVELLPRKDNHAPDFLAAKLIYKLLSYKFNPNK